MKCYCCGEEREPSMVASLMCHAEIKVCRICVGWLQQRTGGIDVTPTLPVSDMDEAIRFYESAGFDIERYDDGFAFVRFGDQSVFDLDLISNMDPSANHAGCYIITADADEWHCRFSSWPSGHADQGHAMGHARVHPDGPERQQRANRPQRRQCGRELASEHNCDSCRR